MCYVMPHHIRELTCAHEQYQQAWAKKMEDLLLAMNEAVHKAGGALSSEEAEHYRSQYRTVISEGLEECPEPPPPKKKQRGRVKKSKPRNLLERLRDYEVENLRFLTDPRVPFTNNPGENDIRMTKVQQKISGCFRSMEGAKIFCRTRSFVLTCQKHGIDPAEGFKMLFEGRLPDFSGS